MSTISTHVLDTARGCPAGGMEITLERMQAGAWTRQGGGTTNDDGRVGALLLDGRIAPGVYRMTFDTGGYHRSLDIDGFYPEVQVCFEIAASDEHYHVPLLISPFGFSTYRGS